MNASSMEIRNQVTEERILFRQTAAETNGELLEFEDFWTRSDHRVAENVHPEMEERWEVISGVLRFRIGGVEQTAQAGGEDPGYLLSADLARARLASLVTATPTGRASRAPIFSRFALR